MPFISYKVNPADKAQGVTGYLATTWKCSKQSCHVLTNLLFRTEKYGWQGVLVRACCQEHADNQE